MKRNRKAGNAGYTFIELMLSSVIILIAVAASGALYLAQIKMHKNLARSLDLYTILDQVISEVSGAPAEYPLVVKSDVPSQYLDYVKCLSDKSLEVGAQAAPTGDSGLGYRLLPLSSMSGDFKKKVVYNSVDYCPEGVEVHIHYESLYNACVTAIQLSKDKNDPTKTVVTKVAVKAALLNAQLATTVDAIVADNLISQGCN